jgi:hypothetical protein
MKKLLKFCIFLTPLLVVGSFFIVQKASASMIPSQTTTLQPGWNVVSTPMVLSSHQFSAPETSSNFDIYLLDPSSPSGWQTMQGEGQTEFQPLYAYFIDNKTGQTQTLTFSYNPDLTPAQRLFQRVLQPGWNAVGIASPDYAIAQGSGYTDTKNQENILNSIISSINQVVDFTAGNIDPASPVISDEWASKTVADVASLNDFRELKGYGIFVNGTTTYIGSQNLDPIPSINQGIISVQVATDSPAGNIYLNTTSTALAKFAFTANNEAENISNLTISASITGSHTLNNVALYSNGTQLGQIQATILGDGTTTYTYNLGNSFEVQPGTTTYITVVGDITGTVTTNDKISIYLDSGLNNAQGVISSSTTNVPESLVEANTLTAVSLNGIVTICHHRR